MSKFLIIKRPMSKRHKLLSIFFGSKYKNTIDNMSLTFESKVYAKMLKEQNGFRDLVKAKKRIF